MILSVLANKIICTCSKIKLFTILWYLWMIGKKKFSSALSVLLLDPESRMDKNQDPGLTSWIRTTERKVAQCSSWMKFWILITLLGRQRFFSVPYRIMHSCHQNLPRILRWNSWTKSRQNEFSSFLFTATSTALPWEFYFVKLTQPLTVSRSVTVHCKGGKPDRKPYPLPDGLRNPYRNLKFENSQAYDQKPQRNCTLMNSIDGRDRG